MQVRMQNLANRQTAASQTAQMAQQIKVQQGEFNTERKTAPRKCIIITVLNMKLVL